MEDDGAITLGEVLAELSPAAREAVQIALRTARNAGSASAWADARRAYQERRDGCRDQLDSELQLMTAKRDAAIAERDNALAELAKLKADNARAADESAGRARSRMLGWGPR